MRGKLSTAEVVAIIITLVLVVFVLGYHLGKSDSAEREGTVSISRMMQESTPNAESAENAQPEEAPEPSPETDEKSNGKYPININTASAAELQALPGIGEVLAGRIVAYRESNGAFERKEDIILVDGIGSVKLGDIIDKITVGGEGNENTGS